MAIFCWERNLLNKTIHIHTLFFLHQWIIFVGIHMYHRICQICFSVYIHVKQLIKSIWSETSFVFPYPAGYGLTYPSTKLAPF